MEHKTHIDISGSGTACSEHMEDHAHGIGVKYVYSGKYRLSLAPSTVSGICVRVLLLTLTRIPKYAPSTLTEWYNSPVPAHRARLLHHLLGHTVLVLEMLDATDIIAKTA